MPRAAAKPKKIRVTSAHIHAHREHSKKDHSPKWDGHESWSSEQFAKHYREAMQYYNLEMAAKDLKPNVIKWMEKTGYSKKEIDLFKKTKDWRCNIVMGSIASCLLRGMPEVRADFNHGRSFSEWLKQKISTTISEGSRDIAPVEEIKTINPNQPTIQDRLQDVSGKMTEEFDEMIDGFLKNPDHYDLKAIKPLNFLKGKNCKAAHAKFIKEFYKLSHNDLKELASGNADEQLREGYSFLSRKNVKKLIEFYADIESACNMIIEEGKVARKPRIKKAVSKDKIVEKLKYKKTDDQFKLVSINPVEIIGTKELWCYNTKTRKLGRYVASEFAELGIKGTSITGFSETLSIQKTLRKPADQLKEFKAAGKVALRKFLDGINAVDTKLNGRINEDIILLKVQ